MASGAFQPCDGLDTRRPTNRSAFAVHPPEHFVQDIGVMRHVNVRAGSHMAVVGPGQRRGAGRKDDVVAVAVETGESTEAFGRLGRQQADMPRMLQPHLLRIRGVTEASQEGAAMRTANGDESMRFKAGVRAGLPCPHRQATHAVGNHDRCQTGLA